MTYLVFADEQKKIEEKWDYHALVFISKQKAQCIFEFILSLRTKYNFHGEIKFSGLNKKGTGATYEIIKEILLFIYQESLSASEPSLLFSVTAINRDKLDFSFFGDDNSPSGKYATIYNRFFRSTLKGAISLFFKDRVCSEISHIIHDSEGNLETHNFFDWHVIKEIARFNNHINFKSDKVLFLNSDHNKETFFPKGSHIIQLVDVLIGAITHCIHHPNNRNKGKNKAANIIAPLVQEILNPQPQYKSHHYIFRRYSISHFPKNNIQNYNGDYIPGEFYKLKTIQLLENQSSQIELF